MKYPQNFHGSASGLNTVLNLTEPSVEDVKDQAFSIIYEGSKQCTTTGACGILHNISSKDINTYERGLCTALNSVTLTNNPYLSLEKYQLAAITPALTEINISNPRIGEWIITPEKQNINDSIVYKPGLFKTYKNDIPIEINNTIESLNEQNEPWGAPHASLFKFKSPEEFNLLANFALHPISITTYGGNWEKYFSKCYNNSVWSVNMSEYEKVLGIAARPQEGEMFRERGWGVAPTVGFLNGIEFK